MAGINDLVLVHIDNKPGFFARIENITPDVKQDWWQVKLLVLTFPLQVFTWVLDESQINGASYTMGGTPIRLEKVEPPVEKKEKPTLKGEGEKEKKEASKVISLSERKKKE